MASALLAALNEPDTDEASIVDKLEKIFRKLNKIKELPHHFDPLLFDKLLYTVDFRDKSIQRLIESELMHNVFEHTSEFVTFFLRVINRIYIVNGFSFTPMFELGQYVKTIHCYFYTQYGRRPNSVVSAIFQLTATTAVRYHNNYCKTLEWAAQKFSDNVEQPFSASMRREIEMLFSLKRTEEIEEPLLLLALIFKDPDFNESLFVINSLARIADKHKELVYKQWDAKMILLRLLVLQPTGLGLCNEMYQFLVSQLGDSPLKIPEFDEKPFFALRYWFIYREKHQTWPREVDSLLLDKGTVEQIGLCLPYLLRNGLTVDLFNILLKVLETKTKTDDRSFLSFFQKIHDNATLKQKMRLIETCSLRIVNSTNILTYLYQNCKQTMQEIAPRTNLPNKLQRCVDIVVLEGKLNEDPEIIDIGLEIASIASISIPDGYEDELLFHLNENVCLSAVKYFLGKAKTPTDAIEICEKVIEKSNFTQTKIPALKYLYELLKSSSTERAKDWQAIFEMVFEEDDNENKWVALHIAKILINDATEGAKTRQILEKYFDDYFIGKDVRLLCGQPRPDNPRPDHQILEEVIAALERPIVDVPDCS